MTPYPFIDLAYIDAGSPAADPSRAPLAGVEHPDSPCHRWLIRHLDGSVASHSFSPPASRTEVASWYPGAALEPEPEQEAPP